MINLLDLDKQQMRDLFNDRPYRGSQVFNWVFGKTVSGIDGMTNLSKTLRSELSKSCTIAYPEHVKVQVSSDGTEKHAFRLADGLIIESVLMPEKSHWSLCISSQAGCALSAFNSEPKTKPPLAQP